MPELIQVKHEEDKALSNNLVGRTIDTITHLFYRLKSNGTASKALKGPKLTMFRGGKILGIKARNTELAIEVQKTNGTIYVISWRLGQGSAFDFIDVSDIDKYPFCVHQRRSRTNMYFTFKDSTDVWILVDCWQFVNYVSWRIVRDTTLETFQWSNPTPCFLFETTKWIPYIQSEYLQKYGSFPSCSIAKLLTNPNIFAGVGAYMRSEILARVWKHCNLPPWHVPQVEKGVVPGEIYQLYLAGLNILEVEKSFWPNFSLKHHNAGKVKQYLNDFLQAYRKENASYYSFKGFTGKKKESVYTFADGSPTPSISTEEKWLQLKNNPLTKNSLGVGTLWWHSKSDYPKLEAPPTQISVSTPQTRRKRGKSRKGKLQREIFHAEKRLKLHLSNNQD